MLALSLLLFQVGAPVEPIPFEKLGRAWLRGASEGAAPNAGAAAAKNPAAANAAGSEEARFLRAIAPLHVRLDLGAVELWIPRRTVDADSNLQAGPKPKTYVPVCEAITTVEANWIAGAALDDGDRERTKRALTRVRAWLKSIGDTLPERTSDAASEATWLRTAFLKAAPVKALEDLHEFGWVVILAPDRAQYLGVIGAAGVLDPEHRSIFWSDSFRRASTCVVYPDVVLVPLAFGPAKREGSAFENHPLGANEQRQYVAHALSHLITSHLLQTASTWFGEGLALYDTIRATGADETLCTGFQSSVQIGLPVPVGSAALAPFGVLRWVSRELSPYRDGSSPHYFVSELARAHEKRGFGVTDLDAGRTALVLAGPFLAGHASAPAEVDHAPDGVKKGYAEFFRAYCCAFVRFLDETRIDDSSLFERALRVLRAHRKEVSADDELDTGDVLERLSGKKLGKLGAADQDLEAAFVAWLLRKL